MSTTCQFMTVTGEGAQQAAFTIPSQREGFGLMLKAEAERIGVSM